MTLKAPIHISALLRGLKLPTDEVQLRELVEALGGTDRDLRRAVKLYRSAQATPAVVPPVNLPPIVPMQLLGQTSDFVGRDRVLTRLNREARDNTSTVVIYAVDGMAGVGKTATANEWAHRIKARYPDGQLRVNLRGFDPAGEPLTSYAALGELLSPFVRGASLPATLDGRAAEFRTQVANRRLIVLLDNARDAEQVRPLLPGTNKCLTIITSRNMLTPLVATDAARRITIGLMTQEESRALLRAKIGDERVDAAPDAVDAIIKVCARLPLALSIVGANIDAQPSRPLAEVADELRERLAEHNLEAFDAGDPRTNLGTIFSWSYDLLSPEAAEAFRLLALNPAVEFSQPVAASMLARDGSTTQHSLRELERASLLEQPVAGRYRYHDLLKTYALGLADCLHDETLRAAVGVRLVDHYLHSAHDAALQLYPLAVPIVLNAPLPGVTPEAHDGYTASFSWFDDEREALTLLVALAADQDNRAHTWQLAWTCQDYFRRRGYWREWATSQRIALAAAEHADDLAGMARTHNGLGRALTWLGETDEAKTEFHESLRTFEELGDLEGMAHVYIDIGTMWERIEDFPKALAAAKQSLAPELLT